MIKGIAELLKWFFPNPSTDLKSFVLSIIVCAVTSYGFVSYGKGYVDQKHEQVTKQLVEKEGQAKQAIIDESQKIILALKAVKETIGDIKKDIRETNKKVWELSRTQ